MFTIVGFPKLHSHSILWLGLVGFQRPSPKGDHLFIWLWVKANGIPFWAGEFTTHFRTYFSGDWHVHWGQPIWIFDPWPIVWASGATLSRAASGVQDQTSKRPQHLDWMTGFNGQHAGGGGGGRESKPGVPYPGVGTLWYWSIGPWMFDFASIRILTSGTWTPMACESPISSGNEGPG